MRSRNRFRARINQHRLAVERVLDDDVVVVIAAMQLHGHCTRRNPHRSQHGSQKDDVIVAVTVGKTLQADGIEQHQRCLDEFAAIGIGQINKAVGELSASVIDRAAAKVVSEIGKDSKFLAECAARSDSPKRL